MSKRKLIPHIRFKEFEEEWKTKKLEEITEIAMGQSPSSKNYLKSEIKDSYVLIQGNADIKNNKIVPRVWTTQATKLSNPGDIILTVRAPVGELARNKFQAVIGRGVSAFKGNDFLFYYLQKLNIEGYWQHLSAGSTFESVSSKDIASTATELTSIAEQQKIGNLLAKLDRLLDLQQQKLNQLELLKKALLQKLFPKQDAKIPELRFKGFEGEWKKEKLGNIAKLYQPITISRSQMKKKGYPVFGANGFIGYYDEKNHSTDQVTISARGENAGLTNYVFAPVWITGNSMVVNVDNNKKIDKVYLYFYLSLMNIKKYVTGGAQPQLTREILKKVEILITLFREQQKIGNLLAKIDRLIELENKKFSNLKLIKKSLLQNMFVE